MRRTFIVVLCTTIAGLAGPGTGHAFNGAENGSCHAELVDSPVHNVHSPVKRTFTTCTITAGGPVAIIEGSAAPDESDVGPIGVPSREELVDVVNRTIGPAPDPQAIVDEIKEILGSNRASSTPQPVATFSGPGSMNPGRAV